MLLLFFFIKWKELQEVRHEHVKEHGVSRERGVVEFTWSHVPCSEVEWYLIGPSTDS